MSQIQKCDFTCRTAAGADGYWKQNPHPLPFLLQEEIKALLTVPVFASLPNTAQLGAVCSRDAAELGQGLLAVPAALCEHSADGAWRGRSAEPLSVQD